MAIFAYIRFLSIAPPTSAFAATCELFDVTHDVAHAAAATANAAERVGEAAERKCGRRLRLSFRINGVRRLKAVDWTQKREPPQTSADA